MSFCKNLSLFGPWREKSIFLKMGSCVSVQESPDSPMKIGFAIDSKEDKLLVHYHTEEKVMNGGKTTTEFDSQTKTTPASQFGYHPSSLRVRSRDFGSKEETFFDSLAWLESDCEDDFFSVNGDLTPSRGSTPNHQRSNSGTPQLNKSIFMDRSPVSKPEPSPAGKKMKLADLFQESMRREQGFDDDENGDDANTTNGVPDGDKTQIPPKSSQSTPYISGANSIYSHEATPIKDAKREKEKRIKAAQCCLPSLIQSFSFNDRKKELSPGCHNGG